MIFEFLPVEPQGPFAQTDAKDWNNWIWQLQNTLSTEADFETVFTLADDNRQAFQKTRDIFKIATTPYYASLAARSPAIKRIVMPALSETEHGTTLKDPLAEVIHSPHKRIIHRYSDRVLFLVTDVCSVYCRFCTRKRFTGHDEGFINAKDYEGAIDYIANQKGLREVILSGGDPLTLSTSRLEMVLRDLRKIPHVEIIRIGTRMPVVCPQRVDESLVKTLRAHKPVFLMTHFNHPVELTTEARQAVELFVDHGVPVFNQMVLLNGVNNHAAIVQALSRRLLYLRVKPYYMFQCDPSEGTDHLRTTIESSQAISRELWGHLSGLAMPVLSLDIPDGGGKVSLVPDFATAKSSETWKFTGWDGRKGIYKNPTTPQIIPEDARDYFQEWDNLKNSKRAPVEQI